MTKEMALYREWVQALKVFPAYAEELEAIKDQPEEIKDRFYKELNFGTAGLRGVIGMGTNRMNPFTVGKATQGLAAYLLKQNPTPSVAVCFDSRNFSTLFAEHAATIFAANGIKVHLFPELAPTPTLAFAVRDLGCDCGVMVTASHNPAEYNGYKVFNGEGCQIGDTVANGVFAEMQKVEMFGVSTFSVKKIALADGLEQRLISYVSKETKDRFYDAVLSYALQPELCKEAKLNIAYTPLNGTGNIYVQEVFKRLDITNYGIVPEQEYPDGNFPTAPYPNPEFPEALELGLKLAKERSADALIATDPDADRIAVAVRHGGGYTLISGNQLGILLLDYIVQARRKMGTMPENPIAIRSIVSSKMFDHVAKDYGVVVEDVLTGFKYIGERMVALEKQGQEERFIFGYEEAAGYLSGHHVRDKDAIIASLTVCEMLAFYKLQGSTLVDRLEALYQTYGYYKDTTLNLQFPGAEGMVQMSAIMKELRGNPPTQLAGTKITAFLDYGVSIKYQNGTESPLTQGKSNVVELHLEDGNTIIIRPSGTEPKLKIYHSVAGKTLEAAEALTKRYTTASEALVRKH